MPDNQRPGSIRDATARASAQRSNQQPQQQRGGPGPASLAAGGRTAEQLDQLADAAEADPEVAKTWQPETRSLVQQWAARRRNLNRKGDRK